METIGVLTHHPIALRNADRSPPAADTAPLAGRSRIALPKNIAYERDAPLAMRGTHSLVPMFTCPIPLECTEEWKQEALARVKEETGRDDWDIRFVEIEGKPHVEIRHSVRLSGALREYLFHPDPRYCRSMVPHHEEIDPAFAAIANPICEEFERLWLAQTKDLSHWRHDLSGMSVFNCNADRRTYVAYVQTLLTGDSFAVGEAHEHFTPKSFVWDNLLLFKQHGFTTLYVEGPREAQDEIDAYLNSPPDTPLSATLKEQFNYLLLTQAKSTGMRVVAIDSDFALSSTLGKPDQSRWERSRIAAFNYCAVQIIEADEAKRQGGKFIVCVGRSHLHFSDEEGPIMGMSEVLGLKSVVIQDIDCNDKGAVKFALISADQKRNIDVGKSPRWLAHVARCDGDIFICAWWMSRMHASETPPPLPQSFGE